MFCPFVSATAGADACTLLQVFEFLFFVDPERASLWEERLKDDGSEGALYLLVWLVVRFADDEPRSLVVGHRGRMDMKLLVAGPDAPRERDDNIGGFVATIMADRIRNDSSRLGCFVPRRSLFELQESDEHWVPPRPLPADTVARRPVLQEAAIAAGADWVPYSSLEVPTPGRGTFLIGIEMSAVGARYRNVVGNEELSSTNGPELVMSCIEEIDLAHPQFRSWRKEFAAFRAGALVPENYEFAIAGPRLDCLSVEHYDRNGSVRRFGGLGRDTAAYFVAESPGDFSLGMGIPHERPEAQGVRGRRASAAYIM